MNTKIEIVNTRTCSIPNIGDFGAPKEVELSIIRQNGKYGLLYGNQVYSNTLIFPMEYDNLFFVEVDGFSYLVAVISGKQGLFKLELDENKYDIISTKIIPLEYDRVITFRNDQLLILNKGDLVCCYDPIEEIYFAEGDHIQSLYDSFFLCTSNGETVIWNSIIKKPIFIIKQRDYCEYIGSYKQGEVFKITYYDDNNCATCQQLLFFSYQRGHDVHLSPKAERIILHTRVGNENRVVGIDMSWGDWDSPIDINEICKEKVL